MGCVDAHVGAHFFPPIFVLFSGRLLSQRPQTPYPQNHHTPNPNPTYGFSDFCEHPWNINKRVLQKIVTVFLLFVNIHERSTNELNPGLPWLGTALGPQAVPSYGKLKKSKSQLSPLTASLKKTDLPSLRTALGHPAVLSHGKLKKPDKT